MRRRRNGWLWAGLFILLLMLVAALFPAWFAAHSPHESFWPAWTADGKLIPRPMAPGAVGLLLGSDYQGRDLLSRVIWGTRTSLGLAVVITLARMLVAVPLGLWSGWRGGTASRVIGALSGAGTAIPLLLILILVLRPLKGLSAALGADGLWLVAFCVITALGGVPRLVEGVRRRVAAAAGAPFLEGAVAVGASRGWILRKHVLPHVLPEVAVIAAAEIAWVLLLLGQLGIAQVYIGGGEQDIMTGQLSETIPEWAQIMAVNRGAILGSPRLVLVPGAALTLAAIGFHMTAEGLRRRWQHVG